MSANIEKSNLNIILIGVAVGILCCVISIVTAYIVFRSPSPAENKIAPGLIGGPCNNGRCTAPDSICKFNECYEQCKGRNAWPCDNDGDIPYIKTYWCDYSGCPPWQPPKSAVAAANAETKLSMFEQAMKQQQAIDAETAKIKIAQQEASLAEKKAAGEMAAQQEAEQKDFCQCITLYKGAATLENMVHVQCGHGKYNKDGNDTQNWCYVKGGINCKKASPSENSDLANSAWRLC